jgi:23S rRNA pseudouridine1911/1915/1917 synthase
MDTLYHPHWPVFYEDNHLLVLYKPAGLVMQRDHKNKASLLELAKAWIKMRHHKPGRVFAGLVHRLDAPVAGVVALARTSKAASRLSAQFRNGNVEKSYQAVVVGAPPKEEDRLVHHVVRVGRLSMPSEKPSDGSRIASLRYRLQERQARMSLLTVVLETGRRHQIRAQLSAIGCPIQGDVHYGAPYAMAHGRIALLAHKLGFHHPTRGIRLQFTSPVPEGWPWPDAALEEHTPRWTMEEFLADGMTLPDLTGIYRL